MKIFETGAAAAKIFEIGVVAAKNVEQKKKSRSGVAAKAAGQKEATVQNSTSSRRHECGGGE